VRLEKNSVCSLFFFLPTVIGFFLQSTKVSRGEVFLSLLLSPFFPPFLPRRMSQRPGFGRGSEGSLSFLSPPPFFFPPPLLYAFWAATARKLSVPEAAGFPFSLREDARAESSRHRTKRVSPPFFPFLFDLLLKPEDRPWAPVQLEKVEDSSRRPPFPLSSLFFFHSLFSVLARPADWVLSKHQEGGRRPFSPPLFLCQLPAETFRKNRREPPRRVFFFLFLSFPPNAWAGR